MVWPSNVQSRACRGRSSRKTAQVWRRVSACRTAAMVVASAQSSVAAAACRRSHAAATCKRSMLPLRLSARVTSPADPAGAPRARVACSRPCGAASRATAAAACCCCCCVLRAAAAASRFGFGFGFGFASCCTRVQCTSVRTRVPTMVVTLPMVLPYGTRVPWYTLYVVHV